MINIDVAIKSKKWLVEKNIENFVKKSCLELIPLTDLGKILQKKISLEVAILLMSDHQMQKINFLHRGKNKPTNVLSFGALDENLIRTKGLKSAVLGHQHVFLGDILLAYETIKKESLAQKKQMCDHMRHLILHSLLHLIGFDHENENEAKIMEDLEIKILKKIGITNPYNASSR